MLIIKRIKDKSGKEIFAPLDAEDKADNAAAPIISAVLLKYQWPMVIASDLTAAEKDELLAQGKQNAEAIFIQKKIREELKGQGDHYFVVFIPTTLYELFCIFMRYNSDQKNEDFFVAQVRKIGAIEIDLQRILQKKQGAENFFKFAANIRQQVFDAYRKVNAVVFSKELADNNLQFYVNSALAVYLFFQDNTFAASEDITELSHLIESKIEELLKKLVTKIVENKAMYQNFLDFFNIISKCTTIEYEAQKNNSALLFRGTGTVTANIDMTGKKQKTLAGDLIQTQAESVLEKEYIQKKIGLYSISFGNSLFAGRLGDLGANAFSYFISKGFGYALLINKKDYVEHQNNNLFFIPPLSTLAAIFQGGEYFHARTKTALFIKKNESQRIQGLASSITDPAGIILITRDPLKHAELFSKFLAENGRIVQMGDQKNLTEEEKKFADEIVKNQAAAAQYYKDVRTVAPVVQKASERRKTKLEKRKNAQAAQ